MEPVWSYTIDVPCLLREVLDARGWQRHDQNLHTKFEERFLFSSCSVPLLASSLPSDKAVIAARKRTKAIVKGSKRLRTSCSERHFRRVRSPRESWVLLVNDKANLSRIIGVGDESGVASYLPSTLRLESFKNVCDFSDAMQNVVGGDDPNTSRWFLKHRFSDNGQDVRGFSSQEAVLRAVSESRLFAYPAWRNAYVLQKEVPPILCSDGHKVTLRQFCLVWKPGGIRSRPLVFAHEHLLLKRCSKPYTLANGDELDWEAHVGTPEKFSVNSLAHVVDGPVDVWQAPTPTASPHVVQTFEPPDNLGKAAAIVLRPFIDALCEDDADIAFEDTAVSEDCTATFAFVGLDFICSAKDRHPKLLELNCPPSLSVSEQTTAASVEARRAWQVDFATEFLEPHVRGEEASVASTSRWQKLDV